MFKLLKYSERFSVHCKSIQKNINKLHPNHGVLVTSFHNTVCYHSKDNDTNADSDSIAKNSASIAPNVATRYELFTDDKADIILDMEEERDKILVGELETERTDDSLSAFDGLNLERGKTGVFDIEDLVAILKRDNAENIFVCTVPKHLKYVDYMVVITARSHRHMLAMAQFVRKMFKVKCNQRDHIPKIEGKNSDEWIAMDMGNIALHIFSAQIRKHYDIEMLWSVGSEYDTETNKKTSSLVELFNRFEAITSNEDSTKENEGNTKFNHNVQSNDRSDQTDFKSM